MYLSRFWLAALAVMVWGFGFGQTHVTWIFDLNGLEASADGVYIVGDFNGWNLGAHPMSPLPEKRRGEWGGRDGVKFGLNLRQHSQG